MIENSEREKKIQEFHKKKRAEEAQIRRKDVARESFFTVLRIIVLAVIGILFIHFAYQHLMLFSMVPNLFQPYNFEVTIPLIIDIAWALGACVVFWAIGRLLISCFEVFLPMWVDAALSFSLGVGLTGLVYELMGMADALYQIPVTIVTLLILLTLLMFSRRRFKSQIAASSKEIDRPLYHQSFINLARTRYRRTLIEPATFLERNLYRIMGLVIAVITFLTFYYGLLLPESYWDSLILYLGYARKTFLTHAFPTKVVAQVGIGLGANYPHLFEGIVAAIATVANRWSSVFAYALSPLAGLCATLLVYHIVLRISRHKMLAMIAALLFRVIPYGIQYSTLASNYSLAILFTTAFLYLALLYIESGLKGYFVLATLTAAFGSHINYLMLIVWPMWALMIVLAHVKIEKRKEEEPFSKIDTLIDLEIEKEPEFTVELERKTLMPFLFSKVFVFTTIIGLALGGTWYARNIIVTGNPVYAFFPDIFDGKRINREVLASAYNEWFLNGDGVGTAVYRALDAKYWDDIKDETLRRETILKKHPNLMYSDDDGRLRPTLYAKSRMTPQYFIFLQKYNYLLGPVLCMFVVPGIVVFLLRFLKMLRRREVEEGKKKIIFDDVSRFGLFALIFFLALVWYHYFLADFYLYQIIMILPLMAILSYFAIDFLYRSPLKIVVAIIVLCIGIMPGILMGLINFKTSGAPRKSRVDLVSFRNPGMEQRHFWEMVYGDEVLMWEFINEYYKEAKILTHENRHLVFDQSITLIHLDDWEVQKAYKMNTNKERLNLFKDLGITHYLYVPMEARHKVNQKVGMTALRTTVALKFLKQYGGVRFYEFNYDADL